MSLTKQQNKGLKKFTEFIDNSLYGNNIILTGGAGVGKCMSFNTPILMYDGNIKMVQDIKVGDEVMGDDSTPRTILNTTTGIDDMYKITNVKGESYTVNKEHILCLKYSNKKSLLNRPKMKRFVVRWFDNKEIRTPSKIFSYAKKDKEQVYLEAKKYFDNIIEDRICEIKVSDYLKLGPIKRYLNGYSVGIDFKENELDIDPYLLGLWLGDGTSSNSGITNQDAPIIKYLKENLNKYDCYLQYRSKYTYSINGTKRNNYFLNFLKESNLLNNKHIPLIYKCNSRKNRLKLLAGIIDSDGTMDNNIFSISQSEKHNKLMDDIIYLCRSLGFACYKKERITGYKKGGIKYNFKSYRIHISGYKLNEIPTKIKRKQIIEERKQIKDVLVSGIKVEYIGRGNYYGFMTNKNQRFILGNFIVTHNSHLTSFMITEVLNNNLSCCVLAPTNKSLEVIRNKYNKDDIEFFTIAQFLCKIKKYNKKGELTFRIGKGKEYLSRIYDVIFIDECSMIEEDDYCCFEDIINTHNTKIVYIGDNCQLPPVNNKESIIFKDVENIIELRRIIRANNDDIKTVNKRFRNILLKKRQLDIEDDWLHRDKANVYFTEKRTDFLDCIKNNMNGDCKILAYTNKKVSHYNKLARELLFGKNVQMFAKGEKIVFNNHYIVKGEKYYSNQEVTIDDIMITRKQHSNGKIYKVYKLIIGNSEIYRVHSQDEKDYCANFDQLYRELKSNSLTTEKDWENFYDSKYYFLPPIDYSYSLTVHRCVSGNTLISTCNGLQYIKDLTEQNDWNDLIIPLYTREGIYNTSQIYKGYNEPSIIITTKLGYTLEGSHRHPILVINNNGEEEWKKLPDINIGDVIIMKSGLESQSEYYKHSFKKEDITYYKDYTIPNIIDEELSYLLGMLIGDGSYNDDKDYRIDYCSNDYELLDIFKNIMYKKFNIRCGSYKRNENKPFVSLNIYSKLIRLFFKHCGLEFKTHKDKTTPKCILQNKISCQKQFLKALFDTDGGVNNTIHFTNTSYKLCQEVQQLLLNINIISCLTAIRNDCWRIQITGRNARKYITEIGFNVKYKHENGMKKFGNINYTDIKSNIGEIPNGKQLIIKLKNEILRKNNRSKRLPNNIDRRITLLISRIINGTSKLRLSHILFFNKYIDDFKQYTIGKKLLYFIDNNYFFDSISNINYSNCTMYDFTVPISHSFISNGIISHNCQGSTYKEVFVDMNDISSVAINHNDVDLERVLYTAISRASDKLYCYY